MNWFEGIIVDLYVLEEFKSYFWIFDVWLFIIVVFLLLFGFLFFGVFKEFFFFVVEVFDGFFDN